MKKYVLVPVERYQALKTPSATSSNLQPPHLTPPTPSTTTTTTATPPGHLTTKDQAEPLLEADDKPTKVHRVDVTRPLPVEHLIDHHQQAADLEGPQPKKRKQQPKQKKKAVKKQNELVPRATAGRRRQFWLKP